MDIKDQIQQLLHYSIQKFYFKGIFIAKKVLKLNVFAEIIEFQKSIQDWVSATGYR